MCSVNGLSFPEQVSILFIGVMRLSRTVHSFHDYARSQKSLPSFPDQLVIGLNAMVCIVHHNSKQEHP